ncbi:MAG: DEAD/DEAH box helicase [Kineosporiaceae bacterium]
MTTETFTDHGVAPDIAEALAGAGITHPFPIQAMTLPVALTGHDVIGQAKTGTGKTLGFGIPLVQRVAGPGDPGWDELEAPGAPQALVVVPTRELALQVAGDLTLAARKRGARVTTIFGGRAYEPQIEALRTGVEIVVGTPGRLLDLARSRSLDLSRVRILVLDEADEMLDLGFLPDVEKIVTMTPAGRQTMLFSATMPSAVVALGRQYMSHPTHIRAGDPTDTGTTVSAITQWAYRCHTMDKIEILARLLQSEGRGLTMVFTRTRRSASRIADDLVERGFAAAAIHGDLGQGAREQALRAFRNGKVDVLVATEVAARGIDVEDVTHVVNHECPDDARTYLHRIGRTGRAGATGTAVTFVDWADMVRWNVIDRELELGLGEPEETYSTSTHLFDDLRIPAGTTGRLPRTARTRAGLGAEEREDVEGPGARRKRNDTGSGGGAAGSARSAGGERARRSAVQEVADGTSGGGRRRRRRRSEGTGSAETGPADTSSTGPAGTGPAGTGPDGSREDSAERTVAAALDELPRDGTPGTSTQDPADDGAARRPRRRRRGGRGRGSGSAEQATESPGIPGRDAVGRMADLPVDAADARPPQDAAV